MASAASVSIGVANAESPAGSTVRVPITIDGASSLGGLDFILAYDETVLAVENVTAGDLNKGVFEANTSVPGLVAVSMADAAGMSGPGAVAVVTFRVTGAAGQTCELTLSGLQAFDVATLESIPVTATNGRFAVQGAAPGKSTPTPASGSEAWLPAVAAIGLIAALSLVIRKQG